MKIGTSTWLWVSPLTTRSARELLPKIATLGFEAVELPLEDPAEIDPLEVRKIAADHGLTVCVCGVFGPGRDLTSTDATVRRTTHDYIRTCLDFTVAVGAPMVCGPLYSEVGKRRYLPENARQDEWNLAVDGVRSACEEAGSRGLRIAIEPINRFETDLVHTAADAVRMVREIAHPAAGIMLDSFHMTLEENDLERAIVAAGEYLIHMQVSENQRGVPGTGLTDWAALERGLRMINYQGVLNIESFTPENRDLAAAVCIWKRRTPDQDTFAREGLRFLKQLFNSNTL